MTWDDTHSTASDPDNPNADEQLTAAEWNNHVADQKGRIPFGPLADRPSAANSTNGDVWFVTDLTADAGVLTKMVSGSWTFMGFGDPSNKIPQSHFARVNSDRIDFNDANDAVTTANSGTSYTFDLSTANMFEITLTGNVTFSITATGSAGNSFVVYLEQDSTGGRTITWPSSVQWPGGTAPSAPSNSGNLELTFRSPDGGTAWRGTVSGRDFS